MASKHRKCDSASYKKRQRQQHLNHIAKVKLRKEIERKEWERTREWRENQEMIARRDRIEYERLRQRLLNLLTFRMYQLDPVTYQRWAAVHRLNQIASIWGMKIPY